VLDEDSDAEDFEQNDEKFQFVWIPGIGHGVAAITRILDSNDGIGWINVSPSEQTLDQVFVAPRPPQAHTDNWIRHIRNSYHVGKSEVEVRAEVERRWSDPTRRTSEIRLGCFKELNDAVQIVESAKASGVADIQNVSNGTTPQSVLRLTNSTSVTGTEYIRDENGIRTREVHGAVVVIRHDEVLRDYYVVTAYPKGPRDSSL
jgi:hypothetical protein